MTAPLDEKGLEALIDALRAEGVFFGRETASRLIRAYLAASPSPSMEMEVVVGYFGDDGARKKIGFDCAPGMSEPLITLSSAQSALAARDAQVLRLTEENEALRKERDEAVSIARNVTKALVDLTPSGSEYFTHSSLLDCYYADTEACIRAVRDRFDSGHKAKIERVDERRRADAAEARIKALEEALTAVSHTSHRARDRKHYRFPLAVMEKVDAALKENAL